MRLVAFDTETFLIKPGLLAPPMVCLSWAERVDGVVRTGLLSQDAGLDFIEALLDDPNVTIIAHNTPFDSAVICAARLSLLPKVFKAYEEGRIRDTKVRQMLKEIAQGRVEKNGKDLVLRDVGGSAVWEVCDYSLANLGRLYLGKNRRAQKEDPNSWRVRFAELAHLSPDLWPAEARDYALEDAVDALEVFEKQHPDGLNGIFPTELEQTQADFALHLMSCWGMRTDGKRVAELEEAITKLQAKSRKYLIKAGFLKPVRLTPGQIADGATVEWVEVEEKGKNLTKKEALAFVNDPSTLPPDSRVEQDTETNKYRLIRRFEVPYRWGKDTKALQGYVERVYARKGRVAPRTAGENPQISTDRDAMDQSGSRLLRRYAETNGLSKIKETYIPILKKGVEVPVNTRFKVLVNSGRTSSGADRESGDGFNAQNMPTGSKVGGVRECFVPRPGWVLVSVDFDAGELKGFAQMQLYVTKGRSRMAEVQNSDKNNDLHTTMAADLLKTTYEQVDKNRKVKGSPEERARNCAKVANFGMMGGLGAQSLIQYARGPAYRVRLTEDEAHQLIRDWKTTWPEVNQYFKWVNSWVGMGNAKFTHPLTGYVRGALEYTSGCNHPVQHLVAYGAKKAVWRVAKECYVDLGTPLYGCRPVNFVHDEVLMEAPEDRASEAADRLAKVMCEEMQKVIPDVRITASPASMRFWYKEAKEVRDENGRLVPWSPAPKNPGVAAS